MASGKGNYPNGGNRPPRYKGPALTKSPWGGARNTKPVAIRVKHGGSGAKMAHARLDKRTWAGRIYVSTCKDLVAHLGGEPTAAQMLLIDHAARLKIALDIAWGAAMNGGLDKESPSFDHFIKALRNQRETLNLLGLERKSKSLSLAAYIEEKATHEPA